ncbi:Uncharacterized protein TCM_016455 [Theobroma cacao]|uniref:Uncharacterized protein n=1 Tax=Theobroma cacao TaxID=3641 RepID=A0A061G608_THECC|nr:Uncharacterized protein TCM_016455 [Theobroma cacao]
MHELGLESQPYGMNEPSGQAPCSDSTWSSYVEVDQAKEFNISISSHSTSNVSLMMKISNKIKLNYSIEKNFYCNETIS